MLQTLSRFSRRRCLLQMLSLCDVCLKLTKERNKNSALGTIRNCVASVEVLSSSVSTVTALGGHWRVCVSCCGLSPPVGLWSRLKRADNSLQVTSEGPLISQTQSQINGLVAEFRRSIFSDNQRLSGALLGEILFKHKGGKMEKEKVKRSHVCKEKETKSTNQICVESLSFDILF